MTPGCISDPIKYTFLSSAAQHKILHQNIKNGNFSHGSEKGAKNSYDSYPTEFVFEVKNTKITPVSPILSVIQKEKCLTSKDH
jgi:hypothetical protein